MGRGGLGRRDRLARIRRHGIAALASISPAARSGTAPRWASRCVRCSAKGRSARSTPTAARRCARSICRRLVSGEWTGTMNLTEPQAGSDLNAVKARAERAADGTYRVFGQKIFITYGEHDMADNIVHLVLARLPDAPPGTRGLSLFLVPKFLVEADGSLGARNDVRCASIEHKLGIHASPTCVMIYGDARRGDGLAGRRGESRPRGDVRDDEQRAARASACRAWRSASGPCSSALAYARERRQGRSASGGAGMSPILEHPDVQRMLMTMKALVQAARGICHLTGGRDRPLVPRAERRRARGGGRARRAADADRQGVFDRHRRRGRLARRAGARRHGLYRGDRRRAAHARRAHRRDLRRHQRRPGDRPRAAQVAALRRRGRRARNRRHARDRRRCRRARRAPASARRRSVLREAVDALERRDGLHARDARRAIPTRRSRGASPYLRLFGLALGGACLAKAGLAAQDRAARERRDAAARPHRLARFFAEKLATAAPGLAQIDAFRRRRAEALRSRSWRRRHERVWFQSGATAAVVLRHAGAAARRRTR